MAILWTRSIDGCCYEIRKAGRSIRLYTNNVLHSQYNPKYIFGGGVWDLLSLPALWYVNRRPNILMLGVGGGAVIKQMERIITWENFTAVDINPTHIEISRRFFGVNSNIKMIQADAESWLDRYKGTAFDIIIDDVFFDIDGEATRAIKFSKNWFALLANHLSETATLVVNFEDDESLRRHIRSCRPHFSGFKSCFRLTTPYYGNSVCLLSKQYRESSDLRRMIAEMRPRSCVSKLNYQIRNIPIS